MESSSHSTWKKADANKWTTNKSYRLSLREPIRDNSASWKENELIQRTPFYPARISDHPTPITRSRTPPKPIHYTSTSPPTDSDYPRHIPLSTSSPQFPISSTPKVTSSSLPDKSSRASFFMEPSREPREDNSGIHRMDEKELLDIRLQDLGSEGEEEEESKDNRGSIEEDDMFVSETLKTRVRTGAISEVKDSDATARRKASSGSKLNYLKTSGSLSRSIGSSNTARLHYDKWTPFNPTSNVLILFTGFGMSTSSELKADRTVLAITKYFVPIGYVVYALNYQSTSTSGHISSWKELRHDVHKFLKFIISPKTSVFLYCRSAGCLVILDYLLHQYNSQDLLKGVILSKPALSFLEPTYAKTVGLNRIAKLVKSFSWTKEENNTTKFLAELTKSSRFILKNAAKLTIPILMLHFESRSNSESDSLVDSSVNMKFYQQIMFSRRKDMIIYPAALQEHTPVGRSKEIADIHSWLKRWEMPIEDTTYVEGNYWTAVPQELKCFIFSFLDMRTVCRSAAVSKAWRNLTSICLEEIDLSGEKQRNNRELIRYVTTFPFLKSLNLDGWSVVTDSDVQYITERCQALQRLLLGGCWLVTDVALHIIGETCIHLRILSVRGCPKITNEGLCALAKSCSVLESLNLSKCTQLTSEGLAQLAAHCPFVTELDLSYHKLGRIQAGLERFTQLEKLYLEGRQLRTEDDIDNEDLNGHLETLFEHLPNLIFLSLQGNPKVTPRVKEILAQYCPKLVSVNLKNT